MRKNEDIKDRDYPMFKLTPPECRVLKRILWKYRFGIATTYLCFNLPSNKTGDGIRSAINEGLGSRNSLDGYQKVDFSWKGYPRRMHWIKLLLEHNK